MRAQLGECTSFPLARSREALISLFPLSRLREGWGEDRQLAATTLCVRVNLRADRESTQATRIAACPRFSFISLRPHVRTS